MKKVHIVIIVVALISVLVIFGLFEPRKSIFTERLGDMTVITYETGETAKQQISNMFALKDIPLEKGYSAVYQSNKGRVYWIIFDSYDTEYQLSIVKQAVMKI